MYSVVQRSEKEKDTRYIREASAPAAVTVYQTCNTMYICNSLISSKLHTVKSHIQYESHH